MKLYELSQQYQQLLDAVDDAEGELSEEQMAQLLAVEDDFHAKMENTAKVIRAFQANVEAIEGERTRLAERQRTLVRTVDRLKSYVLQALRSTGLTKVKGALLTVMRRKAPISCEVVDAEAVPDAFKRPVVDVRVDRAEIIAHFRATGKVVPGVQLHTDNEYLAIT